MDNGACVFLKKSQRKVQGVPQSQAAAHFRHEEEEETDKRPHGLWCLSIPENLAPHDLWCFGIPEDVVPYVLWCLCIPEDHDPHGFGVCVLLKT